MVIWWGGQHTQGAATNSFFGPEIATLREPLRRCLGDACRQVRAFPQYGRGIPRSLPAIQARRSAVPDRSRPAGLGRPGSILALACGRELVATNVTLPPRRKTSSARRARPMTLSSNGPAQPDSRAQTLAPADRIEDQVSRAP